MSAAVQQAPRATAAGRAGPADRRAVEDLRGDACAGRCVARHPAGRDPCAGRPERLRQVDADQGARRLPRAGCRQRGGDRRGALRPRPRGARRAPLRPSGPRPRARAQRHGQPRAARRLRPRSDGPGALARTGAGDPPCARALRRRPRHPPPAGGGHAGRADGRRDRRGAPGLAGRPRRARPRRADRGAAARRGRAAVRDGPRGPAAPARACCTSRTASTRSSSWPIA